MCSSEDRLVQSVGLKRWYPLGLAENPVKMQMFSPPATSKESDLTRLRGDPEPAFFKSLRDKSDEYQRMKPLNKAIVQFICKETILEYT